MTGLGMTGLALTLQLTAPVALWGLSLALPIFALHLYHRRRVTVLVPFLPLLLESSGPARREARFKRLREALSLVLRLLALGCAVLALGGLRPAAAGAPPRDLFLVVDADVTTATREAGGTPRLGRALALAEAWVRAQPGTGIDGAVLDAPVSVLLARETPQLLVAPTTDRTRALERLAVALPPAAATTDLGAAVRMAVDAASARSSARVVVLSARALTPPETPSHVTVEVHGIGRARDDQGFVDMAVERARDRPEYRVRVTLRNEATERRTRPLVVRVADEIAAREDVLLEGGGRRDVTFTVAAPQEAAWLEVRLEDEDVFPANDSVHARLVPVPRPSLLVVHGGAVRPYTVAVVNALVESGFVDKEASGYVRAADLSQAKLRDVVLVDGVALPPAALRPGAYVFLAPLAGALPFDLGDAVDEPLIWRMETAHPLMRDLDFRRAFVLRGRTLQGEGLTPLAFAEGRAVIGEGEREGVRYVVLGLDPEGSALPGQTVLPDFVRRAILRLARAPVAPLAPFYRRGEVLRPSVRLPGGPEATIVWTGPEQDPVLAQVARGRARVRVDPQGDSWRVPAGATGRATLTTTSGGRPWEGHTALFDGDPTRTVVPVRAEGRAPPAAQARVAQGVRWRRALLAFAVLFLLLDLLAASRARSLRALRQS